MSRCERNFPTTTVLVVCLSVVCSRCTQSKRNGERVRIVECRVGSCDALRLDPLSDSVRVRQPVPESTADGLNVDVRHYVFVDFFRVPRTVLFGETPRRRRCHRARSSLSGVVHAHAKGRRVFPVTEKRFDPLPGQDAGLGGAFVDLQDGCSHREEHERVSDLRRRRGGAGREADVSPAWVELRRTHAWITMIRRAYSRLASFATAVAALVGCPSAIHAAPPQSAVGRAPPRSLGSLDSSRGARRSGRGSSRLDTVGSSASTSFDSSRTPLDPHERDGGIFTRKSRRRILRSARSVTLGSGGTCVGARDVNPGTKAAATSR